MPLDLKPQCKDAEMRAERTDSTVCILTALGFLAVFSRTVPGDMRGGPTAPDIARAARELGIDEGRLRAAIERHRPRWSAVFTG